MRYKGINHLIGITIKLLIIRDDFLNKKKPSIGRFTCVITNTLNILP